MKRSWLVFLSWLLLLATLGILGITLLATHFMIYDDEGYVLWSVRLFCEGNPLYTEVYSQYGPAFYVGYRLLQNLTGLAFNNETGRLLTLFYWLGSSLITGLIVQKLCKRLDAGLIAATLGFVFLIKNISEPFHPGSMLAFLSIAAGGIGVWLLINEKERHLGWSIALLAATMALIKINVGLFLCAALGSWMLINSKWPVPVKTHVRYLAWAMALVSAAAPLFLMKAKLGEPWVTSVSLVFVCGAFSLLLQITRTKQEIHGAHEWRGTALAAGGLVLAVIVATSLWGTPLGDLVNAVFIAPFRQPSAYFLAPRIVPGTLVLAGGMLGLMLLAARPPGTPLLQACFAGAKLFIVVWFLYYGRELIQNNSSSRFAYLFGPSLVAFMITPISAAQAPLRSRALLWIAWVFLWQTLHAYPVAGTQVTWGTCLWIPILVCAWFEACAFLQKQAPRIIPVLRLLPALAAIFYVTQLINYARDCFRESLRLEVPGAGWVRPPPDISEAIRVLQSNLSHHAGTVFSFPGMFSFNIWSGKPTPTAANVTHWFSLLSHDQQAKIMSKLGEDPRAMVIMHRYHLHYLYENGFAPQGPLKDYLLGSFAPAVRLGEYDLWVKRGRRIEALDTFQIESGIARGWLLPPTQPVTRVALVTPGQAPVDITWTIFPATAGQNIPLVQFEAHLPSPLHDAAQIRLYNLKGELLLRMLKNTSPNTDTLILPSGQNP